MPLTKWIDLLLNSVMPLFAGILIYWWPLFEGALSYLRNYLPDGCWAYAFISSMLIIWDRKIHWVWVVVVFTVAAAYEALQYEHIFAGTGDIRDVAVYFSAFGLALISNFLIKPFYRFSPPNL